MNVYSNCRVAAAVRYEDQLRPDEQPTEPHPTEEATNDILSVLCSPLSQHGINITYLFCSALFANS